MSIDYDRLRELLDEAPTGPWLCEKDEYEFVIGTEDFGIITEVNNEVDGQLIALAPALAHELLRLLGVVEKFDNWLRLSARNTATPAVKNAYLDAQYVLTELLEGGSE